MNKESYGTYEGKVSQDQKKPTYDFLNQLKSYFTSNENHNLFMVSHSRFMTALYKNIKKKDVKFDNLDCLYFEFDSSNNIFNDTINVLRYEKNYENKIHSPVNNYKRVIIMRHCIGCHNIINSKKNSGGRGKVGNKMKKKHGYLKYANCMSDIFKELKKKLIANSPLIQLFNKMPNLRFGSSVVYRALLTSLIVRTVYLMNKPPTPTPTTTQRTTQTTTPTQTTTQTSRGGPGPPTPPYNKSPK
jgi:hypothetical protein